MSKRYICEKICSIRISITTTTIPIELNFQRLCKYYCNTIQLFEIKRKGERYMRQQNRTCQFIRIFFVVKSCIFTFRCTDTYLFNLVSQVMIIVHNVC